MFIHKSGDIIKETSKCKDLGKGLILVKREILGGPSHSIRTFNCRILIPIFIHTFSTINKIYYINHNNYDIVAIEGQKNL